MTDPDLEVTRIRRFGTIVARKRSDGSISAWLARYSSPVDGRRVQRSFESVRDAESWLAGEHELVEMHRRGLKQWVHPTDRDRRKKAGSMTFDELADWYVDTHRKPDGTALRGAARRNLRTDVGHLKDVFGGMTVKQITPDVISKWYFGEHEEGEWVFPPHVPETKSHHGRPRRSFGRHRHGGRAGRSTRRGRRVHSMRMSA